MDDDDDNNYNRISPIKNAKYTYLMEQEIIKEKVERKIIYSDVEEVRLLIKTKNLNQ